MHKGDATYDAAWTAGQTMSVEQALAAAYEIVAEDVRRSDEDEG